MVQITFIRISQEHICNPHDQSRNIGKPKHSAKGGTKELLPFLHRKNRAKKNPSLNISDTFEPTLLVPQHRPQDKLLKRGTSIVSCSWRDDA